MMGLHGPLCICVCLHVPLRLVPLLLRLPRSRRPCVYLHLPHLWFLSPNMRACVRVRVCARERLNFFPPNSIQQKKKKKKKTRKIKRQSRNSFVIIASSFFFFFFLQRADAGMFIHSHHHHQPHRASPTTPSDQPLASELRRGDRPTLAHAVHSPGIVLKRRRTLG